MGKFAITGTLGYKTEMRNNEYKNTKFTSGKKQDDCVCETGMPPEATKSKSGKIFK